MICGIVDVADQVFQMHNFQLNQKWKSNLKIDVNKWELMGFVCYAVTVLNLRRSSCIPKFNGRARATSSLPNLDCIPVIVREEFEQFLLKCQIVTYGWWLTLYRMVKWNLRNYSSLMQLWPPHGHECVILFALCDWWMKSTVELFQFMNEIMIGSVIIRKQPNVWFIGRSLSDVAFPRANNSVSFWLLNCIHFFSFTYLRSAGHPVIGFIRPTRLFS